MPLSSQVSVFYELDSTDPAKPYTAGKGTFITLLIERAGGSNIAANLESYPQMSLEQIVAADPYMIILGDSMWGVTPGMVAERPGWGNLTAVKEGRVFPFDDNLVSRPGPRLVDGLEQLAKLMRPGLSESPFSSPKYAHTDYCETEIIWRIWGRPGGGPSPTP
jgi:iron complex transport system substrate-binding protein